MYQADHEPMGRTKRCTPVLRLLTAALAVLVLADAATRAAVHLRDLSETSHITGIWMTLAQALRDGVLYPPLARDGYYAGTRYMPLYFVLLAGLAKLTGDYLLAAKLLSLLSMAALLAGLFTAARRVTGRAADALAAAALILAFPEGRHALLSPHADGLAAALAVWGLLAVGRAGPRARWDMLAALLFALSFFAKFSSLAGVAAAYAGLGVTERRRAVRLAAGFAALVLAGFGALHLASDGRFLENFRAVGSGGMTFETLAAGPARAFYALAVSARLAFVAPLLIPPALVALFARARRRLGLWDWYLFFNVGTTLLIFTSPGTDLNHLLELEVASVLVLVQLLAPAPERAEPAVVPPEFLARVAAAAALTLGLGTCILDWAAPPPGDAIPYRAVADALPPGGRILTEDATAAVLRGERPVVMDAFAFRLLAERGLVDPALLAARVRDREFDVLVLIRRIDGPDSLSPRLHFGPAVTSAIRDTYRFDRQVGGYYLFVPVREEAGER